MNGLGGGGTHAGENAAKTRITQLELGAAVGEEELAGRDAPMRHRRRLAVQEFQRRRCARRVLQRQSAHLWCGVNCTVAHSLCGACGGVILSD